METLLSVQGFLGGKDKMSTTTSNTQLESTRFPCDKRKYTRVVGEILPKLLEEIFTELGCEPKRYHLQATGVDMKIFLDNKLAIVVEVLNWSIGSRLTDWRKSCIIRNLNKYNNCKRLLIHTVPLDSVAGLEANQICTIEIGYQVLPKEFYQFFLKKGQIERRKFISESVKSEIKSKILEYLDNDFYAIKNLKFLYS